ncbi:MAG TPA: TatD family hydrolase [Burkholderiaceae bacterium]|nr:TatD family hydrolase [Burkholderiaceae bacterium]
MWIDTHCHLDAPEFSSDYEQVRAKAANNNVAHCIIPAVHPETFDRTRKIAHELNDSFALGIHPLYIKNTDQQALQILDEALTQHADDSRLVAVGEIGLDFFVPELCKTPLREKQIFFYREQLKLAKKHGLAVIVHVRHSADQLLKRLRDIGGPDFQWHGIIHAFNGSDQQATQFVQLGMKLGFGGAVTFERALQIRHLLKFLPLEAIVLETDAPDMPPQWLYKTKVERQAGAVQSRNQPSEITRIANIIAELRGIKLESLAQACWQNSCDAVPRIKSLLM